MRVPLTGVAMHYYGGKLVELSGVYHSYHTFHRDHDGDQTLIKGDRFPRCPQCWDDVEYTLNQAAPRRKKIKAVHEKALSRASRQPN